MKQTIYRLILLLSGTAMTVQVAHGANEKPSRPVNSKAQSQAMLAAAVQPVPSTAQSPVAPAVAAAKPPTDLISGRDVSRATLATAGMRQPTPVAPHVPLSVPQVRLTRVASASGKKALAKAAAVLPVASLTLDSAVSAVRYAGERLARVTAYWAAEGDYYTGRGMSATGVRLHDGHCAVDPTIIPYGSVVNIPGVGKFLAVDTGSAVISRTAAREGGHTYDERHALVIDIFFEDRDAGERFASAASKFTAISWWTPSSTDTLAKAARSLFADEDWLKIQSKQL